MPDTTLLTLSRNTTSPVWLTTCSVFLHLTQPWTCRSAVWCHGVVSIIPGIENLKPSAECSNPFSITAAVYLQIAACLLLLAKTLLLEAWFSFWRQEDCGEWTVKFSEALAAEKSFGGGRNFCHNNQGHNCTEILLPSNYIKVLTILNLSYSFFLQLVATFLKLFMNKVRNVKKLMSAHWNSQPSIKTGNSQQLPWLFHIVS